MAERELVIQVKSSSDLEASRGAEYLQQRLSGHVLEVRRVPDKSAQDLGAVLAIVLGSAVLVEIAKGIADLIRRDRNSSIEIEFPNGAKATISNVSQKTVESILAELEDKLG